MLQKILFLQLQQYMVMELSKCPIQSIQGNPNLVAKKQNSLCYDKEMARKRLSEREKPLSISLSTQSTQYCQKDIHATPFHGHISNIWYRKYGCLRPRNINVLCVSIFGKYGFPSPCQAEVKISFNMLMSLYVLCTEQLIPILTFLSTLLTHSLPYNGFRQCAVNRCMACYVCSITLGEIFIPDLNFHRLIMLMYNLKGSLIMLLLLVLIL